MNVRANALSARRLFVTKQRLAGPRPRRPTGRDLLAVVRDTAYVQIDPISVVSPAHTLHFWSRVGNYRPSDLDRLRWEDRSIFEYFAHAASLVLSEDFPLYYSFMRRYPESLSSGWGAWRARARRWIPAHLALRRKVLRQLANGPMPVGAFAEHVPAGRSADGWSGGSDVSAMLFHLQMAGEVMVAGRQGNQLLWGRTQDILPRDIERGDLTAEEGERAAIERAVQALGVASARDIRLYFMRGQYHSLLPLLAELTATGVLHRVEVEGMPGRDPLYVHDRDVGLLEEMGSDAWEPRLSLLGPFDTLLCLRDRAQRLFAFDHLNEMYVPAPKRRYGYYTMSFLWGDRFIGRVDPKIDRANGRLVLQSVRAEPGPAVPRAVVSEMGDILEQLARFVGAETLVYPKQVPRAWKSEFR
jgi:uncharacterized protein